MEGLEAKLGQIMGDPEMMGKLMAMAQNLNFSEPAPSPPEEAPQPEAAMPDMAMIQKFASIAGKSGIDPKQKTLLRALEPYLPQARLRKLEKAMQAAKMANMASGLFGPLPSIFGR